MLSRMENFQNIFYLDKIRSTSHLDSCVEIEEKGVQTHRKRELENTSIYVHPLQRKKAKHYYIMCTLLFIAGVATSSSTSTPLLSTMKANSGISFLPPTPLLLLLPQVKPNALAPPLHELSNRATLAPISPHAKY